ncbi:MAG: putative alanine dehydrogenase/pyridine nucleotide transhydrogenase [Streblomastix strix]|uniref:proton-translocating NAD(P)(+) transhydrogenase n=1 Tax=Streblomastix strix TaxID=222440 RepID=A0A5J4VY91_9EUKA|nr:MAG: putative alanine dehydrogenase/pyridine nucleotide transhydrogenase [Streblomastix strix]
MKFNILIIGAGIAGLAAIGAAKCLHAIVRAFYTRSAVKEQIESIGGEFLAVDVLVEGETVGGYSKQMSDDIIKTTALIPNKPAPKLLPVDSIYL